jgi:hypothetical protein
MSDEVLLVGFDRGTKDYSCASFIKRYSDGTCEILACLEGESAEYVAELQARVKELDAENVELKRIFGNLAHPDDEDCCCDACEYWDDFHSIFPTGNNAN